MPATCSTPLHGDYLVPEEACPGGFCAHWASARLSIEAGARSPVASCAETGGPEACCALNPSELQCLHFPLSWLSQHRWGLLAAAINRPPRIFPEETEKHLVSAPGRGREGRMGLRVDLSNRGTSSPKGGEGVRPSLKGPGPGWSRKSLCSFQVRPPGRVKSQV